MVIQKVRSSLGKEVNKYTNEELMYVDNRMRVLANLVIDRVLKMTPQERKELNKKIKNK